MASPSWPLSSRRAWGSTEVEVPSVVIPRYGGPEVFRVEALTLRDPGPGEVRVAVAAAGINFAEVFCRLGLYAHAPKPPFVPGFEFAGTVEAVGEGVTHLQEGDAVLGVTRFGGYQGGLVAEAARVRRLPRGWSMVEGAAFPAAALTAGYALFELGHLRPDEVVVVHSAAGGVGSTAVQLARAAGARVVGTVGSPAKVELCRSLGCAAVYDHKRDDWAALTKADFGGADIILDALGGAQSKRGYTLLKSRGRLVCYGFGLMTPTGARPNYLKLAWQYLQIPRFSAFPLVSDNKVVAGFNVLLLWDDLEILIGLFDRCLSLADQGLVRPIIGEVASYEQVGRLHAQLQGGQTTGKLVMTFP